MPHNDSPFDFEPKFIDPSGRVVRQAEPRPSRRRRSAEPEPPVTLEELLRCSIREVTEREIRRAKSENDLARLLQLSLEDVSRRQEGNE
jgi:hypothetical protein